MSKSKQQKNSKSRITEICPICEEPKKPQNKTCGKSKCRGVFAETKTKDRETRQKEAEPFIKEWAFLAKKEFSTDEVCVVCGETLLASLDIHHFDKKNSPRDTIRLCGSCHRVFDSVECGLEQLQNRREKYYNFNLDLWRKK
jgi:hypothetical protein